MQITRKLIETLRSKTSLGLMACKKALEAAGGNIELAIKSMKEAGTVFAEKKADRATTQGLIIIAKAKDNKSATMLEINSETDFVIKNSVFQHFAQSITENALQHKVSTIEELLHIPMKDSSQTVEQERQALVAKMGENIRLNQIQFLETNHFLGTYIHKGQYGCILELQGGTQELAKEIAINVIVSAPENLQEFQSSSFYKEPTKTVEQHLATHDATLLRYFYFAL